MSSHVDEKICSAVEFVEGLRKYVSSQRPGKSSQRMITTNGCFDILTAGHVKYLEKAAMLGSFLVVILNSDTSVERLKGPGRPFVPYEQRAIVLAGLHSVRNVIEFCEDTPSETLELLYINGVGPHIHVKGGDYVVPEYLPTTPGLNKSAWDEHYKGLPEAEIVYRYDGRVVTIPFEIDVSTSQIVERIRMEKVVRKEDGLG